MSGLTADKLNGIWAGMTMAWDESFHLDEETYAQNTRRMLAENVQGIYTTGSTGEFYALEFDEFKRMVDIEAELCGRAGMPLEIGCCSDATAKTIRLMEHAASKNEVGAVQVTVPYWMELTDRELLQFFKDLYTACPEMPLVHYNIPRAKRFLTGDDYRRVLEVAPSLIGVKYTFAGSHFGELQEAIRLTPGLSYFVVETLLVSAMLIGARGCYSSLVATNPSYVLEMYAKARTGKWREAVKAQMHLSRFLNELVAFISSRGEGVIDPVADKGLAVATGCLLGSQRCRPPYIGWSDETVMLVRQWIAENAPEFLYNEQSRGD